MLCLNITTFLIFFNHKLNLFQKIKTSFMRKSIAICLKYCKRYLCIAYKNLKTKLNVIII